MAAVMTQIRKTTKLSKPIRTKRRFYRRNKSKNNSDFMAGFFMGSIALSLAKFLQTGKGKKLTSKAQRTKRQTTNKK